MSLRMRLLHIGDTLVPVDPEKFASRLEGAGFTGVRIAKNNRRFRFVAHKA
jgi:hypothetical protein